MARPRKPSPVLKVIGSYDKHPERKRENEPEGVGLFPSEPPKHLSAEIQVTWQEIVAVVPLGVLTGSDKFIVELCAGLLAELRRDPHEMLAARLTQLRVALGALGLTPSDKSKLSIPARNAGAKPSSLLD